MLHWRKIEASLSNRRLMCSSTWTETWLNHYGALVPHRFVIAHRNGIACGIALLTYGALQHDGPLHLDTWHVGTAGEPDADSVCIEYNSLLVRPEDRTEFFRQILKEELASLAQEVGEPRFGSGRFHDAGQLMDKLTTDDEFYDFLTLPAYEML